MRQILILQLRPNDEVADSEFNAFLRYGEIPLNRAHRIRMEQNGIPQIDMTRYCGVIVGGGPANVSDPKEKKSAEQIRYERDLQDLLNYIVKHDLPYLGACYGFGALAQHQQGIISKEQYGEPTEAVTITLCEEAQNDPLLKGLPRTFRAFAGHKEACQQLPNGAVWLARSQTCPIHMFRIKQHIYATQFHPELDAEGTRMRIEIYKHAGYFPPEDAEQLKEKTYGETVTIPMEILRRFVLSAFSV